MTRNNIEEQLQRAIWQHIQEALPEHRNDLTRLFSFVSEVSEGNCWVWRPGKNKRYPVIWLTTSRSSVRKTCHAHRFVLIALGHSMTGLVSRHTCDNMRCVNPAHLVPGTTKDNVHDAMVRRRHVPPPRTNWPEHMKVRPHHWQRLSPSDIPLIRNRLAAGEVQASIAADFGVSFQQISKIKHGTRWGHLK